MMKSNTGTCTVPVAIITDPVHNDFKKGSPHQAAFFAHGTSRLEGLKRLNRRNAA